MSEETNQTADGAATETQSSGMTQNNEGESSAATAMASESQTAETAETAQTDNNSTATTELTSAPQMMAESTATEETSASDDQQSESFSAADEATGETAEQPTNAAAEQQSAAPEEAPATAEQPTVATGTEAAAGSGEQSGTASSRTTILTVRKPPTPPPAPAQPAASAQTAPAPQASASADAEDDEQGMGEMDFGAMLEQYEQEQARFREGDMVEGRVVNVSERGVLIDFGYKSEGMVKPEEFTENEQFTVKQGDQVEVVIRRLDSGDGTAELSRYEAIKRRSWEELERAHNEGVTVKGRVTDRVKGGLNVDINGVEAFLPGSLVDVRPPRNLDVFKGQEIEARVIKFNRKRSNVVLSRKVLMDEEIDKLKSATFEQLGEGYIVEGKIKSLTDYGAFVDLGGLDGLLHVTDMSWGKVDRPSDMFKPGDEVQVKVLKFDRQKERVSLGLKQLQPDPWTSIEERYIIGSKLQGKVSSVTDYGAFVELEPGVEGLVHVSEMSWSKRAKHPNKIVRVGQEVEVQVLRLDPKDRRVSLGMKQIMENPWETIHERFQVDSRVQGRVRNLTEFGAFVEIEEGVDGLVHVSDISHSKKIKHPGEALKKNQEVEAVITHIDTEGRRMSLSIKDLQPSAWDSFVATHKPGDVVKGKISRFANFGVFVELAEELEGLCHISELSDERIEKPEKVFEIGQEMDFKILRIERDVEKIGLSARAVGKEDEPAIDTKSYSSEAKGGMASLGELANLRNMMGGSSESGGSSEPSENN
ncbi:MAG TPA: 30S ribosomal protein S1 [Pyrinomonadaceae bacterium]|nr:30S ribosomal protein S1 [Pyrinomonadaceae bacterium]